jgi:hypothetical protein
MDLLGSLRKFKKKYPLTIAWRLKSNLSIIEKHLNYDEKVEYIFAGQKNNRFYDIFSTGVVAITNKRILIGRKRVVFGYALDSIMPYMYNDLNIRAGIIWGKVVIDTVKEVVIFSNIDKAALSEIETNITETMIKLKKEYPESNRNEK